MEFNYLTTLPNKTYLEFSVHVREGIMNNYVNVV